MKEGRRLTPTGAGWGESRLGGVGLERRGLLNPSPGWMQLLGLPCSSHGGCRQVFPFFVEDGGVV